MNLIFSSLDKALKSLKKAIERSQAAPEDEELRDAVIQRFEYSMDLSWKMIQRMLKEAGIQESEFRTKRDLFREGAKIGLLADPVKWFAYYEARNLTSHSYDQKIAQLIYEETIHFFPDAQQLLIELEKMNKKNNA